MAKPKPQQRLKSADDQKETQKFVRVLIVITIILVGIVFFLLRG